MGNAKPQLMHERFKDWSRVYLLSSQMGPSACHHAWVRFMASEMGASLDCVPPEWHGQSGLINFGDTVVQAISNVAGLRVVQFLLAIFSGAQTAVYHSMIAPV